MWPLRSSLHSEYAAMHSPCPLIVDAASLALICVVISMLRVADSVADDESSMVVVPAESCADSASRTRLGVRSSDATMIAVVDTAEGGRTGSVVLTTSRAEQTELHVEVLYGERCDAPTRESWCRCSVTQAPSTPLCEQSHVCAA